MHQRAHQLTTLTVISKDWLANGTPFTLDSVVLHQLAQVHAALEDDVILFIVFKTTKGWSPHDVSYSEQTDLMAIEKLGWMVKL